MVISTLVLARDISLEEINQSFCQAVNTVFPEYSSYNVSVNVFIKPYQQSFLKRKSEDVAVKVILPADKKLLNPMYLPIVIYENGAEVERLRSRFEVRIYAEIYHALRNIEKGQSFSASDFYLKPVNILNYSSALADKNFDFKDKIVFSFIKAQDPLPVWKLRKKPLVLVGQTVTVGFVYDNIIVKAQAKVLQQGVRGEQIRIRVIPSDKIFKALVVDQNYVEVKL